MNGPIEAFLENARAWRALYLAAIEPYLDEEGDIADYSKYDEATTDFAYDARDLVLALLDALEAP